MAHAPLGLRRAALCVWALVVALLAAPWPAAAQADDVRERARALFEKGLEASDAERWAEAADLFQRSRALIERPSTVFNLVGVLYRVGRYRESIAAVQDYLRLSDPVADAGKRRELEGLRESMEKALGSASVRVEPSAASLEVDGESLSPSGAGYELKLDPGMHALVARYPGYRDHSEQFALESGGRVELRVTLRALPEEPVAALAQVEPESSVALAVPPVRPVEAPAADETSKRRWKRALWIVGAALVAGGVATVLALKLRKDEPDCPEGVVCV